MSREGAPAPVQPDRIEFRTPDCWVSRLARYDPIENEVAGSAVTHELYGAGHLVQPPLVRQEGVVGGVQTPGGFGLTPQLVPTLPPFLPVNALNPPQNGCGTVCLAATMTALHGGTAGGRV